MAACVLAWRLALLRDGLHACALSRSLACLGARAFAAPGAVALGARACIYLLALPPAAPRFASLKLTGALCDFFRAHSPTLMVD